MSSSINRQLRELSSAVERKQLIENLFAKTTVEPDLLLALATELRPEGDEITNWAIMRTLGQHYDHQPEIIAALMNVLEQGRPPSRRVAVETLMSIGVENQDLIYSLVELSQRQENEDLNFCIAKVLSGIGKDDEQARNCLIDMIYQSPSYLTSKFAADALAQIDSGSPEAIKAWLHLVQTGEDYYIRYPSMLHLCQVAVGNPLVVKTFEALLKTQGMDKRSQDTRTIGNIGLRAIKKQQST